MVFFTNLLQAKHTIAKRKSLGRGWIDSLRVYVKGGTGGAGLPPVDGVGGHGGNIYVRANEEISSLHHVRRKNNSQRYLADPGEDSSRTKCMGDNGSDVIIQTPVGVTIVTDGGEVVGDLIKHNDTVLVAKGGPGGDQHSQYCGLRGQARSVKLDLKLIADVGFVGFPNAGKSTLLKAISRASPKIASYPFTTIQPNLGITEYEDLRRIRLADLPGLIEGASYNIGMGHRFLKHVERCSLLLFIVDINGFQFKANSKHRSAAETVSLLSKEIELYKSDLLFKPALLAVTKMDSTDSDKLLDQFYEEFQEMENNSSISLCKFDEIIPISAKFSSKSVELLKQRIRHWLDEHHSKTTELNVDSLEQSLNLLKVSNNLL